MARPPITQSQIIERFKSVHGNKYDYSKVEYKGMLTKVCIICPDHGEFCQLPSNHIKGYGCPKCSGGLKTSLSDFIAQSRQIHGDKYDYSQVNYQGVTVKVDIVCPEHGLFSQTPAIHLKGCGCPKCGRSLDTSEKEDKRQLFITKARKIHGNKYDYSKVVYANSKGKVCIICPEHGEFQQSVEKHLSGQGCPLCCHNKKGSTESFIEKAKGVHGDKYDYSKVEYVNSYTNVCIICPDHGEFWQTPKNHLKGKGCPKCGKQRIIENHPTRLNTDTFISRARGVHGDYYDYSKVDYRKGSDIVEIICPIHKSFFQQASVHLSGCGCPECGLERGAKKTTKGRDVFISRSKEVHGDRYDYSLVPEHIKIRDKVPIICHAKNANGEEHGTFYQTVGHHTFGYGCPRCAHRESKAQNEIEAFVRSILPYETNILINDREILDGLELDIYIPSKKIAIEYNGMIWHSEYAAKGYSYHLNKFNRCKEKGIKLIQILESDFILRKEIVLDKIQNVLVCENGKEKVFARKCFIKPIGKDDAKKFLTVNHIQGYTKATEHLGAFYNDKLVGVMSFMEESSKRWNLVRFATDIQYHCVGLGGKLFNYFIKNYKLVEIKTFADRRWTSFGDDNLYIKLGFQLDGVTKPDYHYTRTPTDYIHKFQFRKDRLMRRFPNAGLSMTMTESEMATKLGYYKIWDCGLYRYIYRK